MKNQSLPPGPLGINWFISHNNFKVLPPHYEYEIIPDFLTLSLKLSPDILRERLISAPWILNLTLSVITQIFTGGYNWGSKLRWTAQLSVLHNSLVQ